MKTRDIFFMWLGFLTILLGLSTIIIESRNNTVAQINKNHAEVIKEIENTNQIELELIDAVNSAIEHIETDPTNFDCQEVAKFLRGVQRARLNLNPEKYGG